MPCIPRHPRARGIALLLERCLALPDATAEELAAWEIDLEQTRHRLEDRLAPARESALLTRRLAAKAGAAARV